MGNTVISNISRFEIDTTAFSPLLWAILGWSGWCFFYAEDMWPWHTTRGRLLRSTHYHWNTRTHTTQRGWESAVVVWNAISRAREGSPTSIPHTISVRLENAHKILLDFNFSSSPGRRTFQTLRQFVQSDKRIISETHTLWTSTAKRDLFSFHLTNYCPWDKSHHTKLQLRMRFS